VISSVARTTWGLFPLICSEILISDTSFLSVPSIHWVRRNHDNRVAFPIFFGNFTDNSMLWAVRSAVIDRIPRRRNGFHQETIDEICNDRFGLCSFPAAAVSKSDSKNVYMSCYSHTLQELWTCAPISDYINLCRNEWQYGEMEFNANKVQEIFIVKHGEMVSCRKFFRDTHILQYKFLWIICQHSWQLLRSCLII
jgi:hypothetical protein